MAKKKKNFRGRQVSIPYEIMFEIFSWLPVKSLMRFKCVSGFCNCLVSESYFLDIHRCRSMTSPGGIKFLLHERKALYTAEQEEEGNTSLLQTERFIELYDNALVDSCMSCCNGLFCVWEPSSVRPALIFNPSTREVRFLPDPNNGSCPHRYFLGFEPEENKHKVFLSESQIEYTKQWVLTLGVDESWRETKSIFPYIPSSKPSVCISGVIYQLVRADKWAIAAFDVKSENFEIIALWNESEWAYCYELIEVEGRLAAVDYHLVRTHFNLWILEHSPKREWQRHTIRFPPKWNYKVIGPISPCTSRDGKIVVIFNTRSGPLCWCYDFIRRRKRMRWRKLEIKGLPARWTRIQGIYSYVEALDHCI